MFIVTWILNSCYSIPCPDNKPDDYGRMPTAMCDVNHMKCDKIIKEKVFTTREEAEKFVANAETPGIVHSIRGWVTDFKIEEKE